MFYTYKEIQTFLKNYYNKYSTRLNYIDALSLMNIHCKPHNEVQLPDFLTWDCSSEEDLICLIDAIPMSSDLGIPSSRDIIEKTVDGIVQVESRREVAIIKNMYHLPKNLHIEMNYKIVYVMKGQCTISTMNDEFHVREQQFCILTPSLIYSSDILEGSLVLTLIIRKTAIQNRMMSLFSNSHPLASFIQKSIFDGRNGLLLMDTTKDRDIYNVYRCLFNNSNIYNEYTKSKLLCCAEMLTIELLQKTKNHRIYYDKSFKLSDHDIIIDILNFIEEHYSEVSLEAVASKFNYEKTYVSKLIKQKTSKNFTEILHDLRIGNAKRMVLHSGFSMEKIAYLVGYNSRDHFTRAFKSAVGVSPMHFRRRHHSSQCNNG